MELNLTNESASPEPCESPSEKQKLEPIIWKDHKPEIVATVILSLGFAAFILLHLVTTQTIFRLFLIDNSLQLIYKDVS